MHKTLTTIALFTMLGTFAVSCQKENIIDETPIIGENNTMFTVSYSVDGTTHQIRLVGEDALYAFLNRMMALAEEGHKVSFRYEEAASRVVSTKEKVTYTTTNQDEALAWSVKMIKKGYSVTIDYDKESGIYTCVAIK